MTSVNTFPDHIFSALDLALRTLREDLHTEVTRPELQARLTGLRSSQLRLLSLVPAEGMRVTDLAARVGMTKQALGEFASVLEAQGLLESAGDPADRRVRRLRPTVDGLEIAALSDQAIRDLEARWRGRIGPERWDAMKQTLLEVHRGGSTGPDAGPESHRSPDGPGTGLAWLERLVPEMAGLVAEADPAAPVRSCPGWTVADLVVHLGEVHVWAEQCIRLADPVERPPAGPAAGPAALAAWYADCAETLLRTLRVTPPEAECWTFGPRPRTAAFWFRRQVHEVAVHRWDLGAALGRDLGYPAELAADGVDEVVTVFFPRQVRLERIPPLTTSLGLQVVGGPTWVLHGDGTGELAGAPDATVTGPADALVLLLWGRLGLDDPRLVLTGSIAAADDVLSAGIVP